MAFLDASNLETIAKLQKAIEAGTSAQLELLVRTWFTVDRESAFRFLSASLDKNSRALPALTQQALTTDRKRAAEILLSNWSKLPREQQVAIVEPLTTQSATMLLLVKAVREGQVNKELINTNQLRKWQTSGDADLAAAIESVWGRIRESDNASGRNWCKNGWHCSATSLRRAALLVDKWSLHEPAHKCHQLHGSGLEVGPNITNNGRGNLDQLISNMLDPSLVIGNAFQARTVLTTDGEVVAGLVVADDDRYLRLKVQGGKVIEFDKSSDIEQVKVSTKSLMPEGLEEQMTQQEFIDLCAYLCLVKAPSEADNELISGTPDHWSMNESRIESRRRHALSLPMDKA